MIPSIVLVDVWHFAPFAMLILLAGLRSLPSEPFESAMMDGASRWQIFWRVILPASAPGIFVGLRLGYAVAWFALVATELIAASSGLGYRILEGRLFFRVDRMIFGAIVIVLFLGVSLLPDDFERLAAVAR